MEDISTLGVILQLWFGFSRTSRQFAFYSFHRDSCFEYEKNKYENSLAAVTYKDMYNFSGEYVRYNVVWMFGGFLKMTPLLPTSPLR